MKKKIIGVPLAYGASGEKVEEAQKALQAAGSGIQVNGKYTIGMRTAVKSFQKKHGLAVTGIIDLLTWEALQGFLKPRKRGVKAK